VSFGMKKRYDETKRIESFNHQAPSFNK